MPTPPTDWLSLLLLTFVLGMKHGFDADHLATIDGLTRHNSRVHPAIARYCGTLFSIGHGLVVIAIALGVSTAAGHWAVPDWFGTLGALISIGFLTALGLLNLRAVLRTEVGAKNYVLAGWICAAAFCVVAGFTFFTRADRSFGPPWEASAPGAAEAPSPEVAAHEGGALSSDPGRNP